MQSSVKRAKVAFAMAIGPGEAEMSLDNIEAIRHLYPEAEIWLRDDATTDGTWERVQACTRDPKVKLSRNSHSFGYYRIAQTYGELLLEIATSQPDMLIKIDPDTVLIRPGLDTLFAQRFAQYGPGICGSYRTSPNGAPRDFRHHAYAVALDALPIGPEKKRKGLRWRPVGYFPHLVRALLNKYKFGENVQGGLYAIDGVTLSKLASSGFLKSIASGRRGMVWTEDVLLTLGVKAVGGAISPLNDGVAQRSTHIQALRPLDITQEQLFSPQLLAIHPVKKEDGELRATMRSLRNGSPQAAGSGVE